MPGTFLNTHLILTTILRGRIVSPILKLRKLSHKAVKQLVKDTQLWIQATCTQNPCLSHWALSGDHNFLFALPCYPSGMGVSSHITGEDCRMAQRQRQAAPPKWGEGLIPRADDSAGPLPPASRWSTIAPSAGIRRSCDRWQLAERCPGHSPPCPCSTCAQASGCLPRWTAPRCPSSWTSTEGLPRWVCLGLFLGTRQPPSQGWSRWWG